MNHSLLIKKIMIFACFWLDYARAKSWTCVENFEQKYCKVLSAHDHVQKFLEFDMRSLLDVDLFDASRMQFSNYFNRLRKDVTIFAKYLRKMKRSKGRDLQIKILDQEMLHQKMSQLLIHLKLHQLQYEILFFANSVHKNFDGLFYATHCGWDIEPLLPAYGFTRTRHGLRKLAKVLESELYLLEYFDDQLHADWVDLKLKNYVLKIQLIRLRNAAIFHPLNRGVGLQKQSVYPS